jgi:hypothetical protein
LWFFNNERRALVDEVVGVFFTGVAIKRDPIARATEDPDSPDESDSHQSPESDGHDSADESADEAIASDECSGDESDASDAGLEEYESRHCGRYDEPWTREESPAEGSIIVVGSDDDDVGA